MEKPETVAISERFLALALSVCVTRNFEHTYFRIPVLIDPIARRGPKKDIERWRFGGGESHQWWDGQ